MKSEIVIQIKNKISKISFANEKGFLFKINLLVISKNYVFLILSVH